MYEKILCWLFSNFLLDNMGWQCCKSTTQGVNASLLPGPVWPGMPRPQTSSHLCSFLVQKPFLCPAWPCTCCFCTFCDGRNKTMGNNWEEDSPEVYTTEECGFFICFFLFFVVPVVLFFVSFLIIPNVYFIYFTFLASSHLSSPWLGSLLRAAISDLKPLSCTLACTTSVFLCIYNTDCNML